MLDSVVCFTYADSSYLPHAVALAESVAFHRSREPLKKSPDLRQ